MRYFVCLRVSKIYDPKTYGLRLRLWPPEEDVSRVVGQFKNTRTFDFEVIWSCTLKPGKFVVPDGVKQIMFSQIFLFLSWEVNAKTCD